MKKILPLAPHLIQSDLAKYSIDGWLDVIDSVELNSTLALQVFPDGEPDAEKLRKLFLQTVRPDPLLRRALTSTACIPACGRLTLHRAATVQDARLLGSIVEDGTAEHRSPLFSHSRSKRRGATFGWAATSRRCSRCARPSRRRGLFCSRRCWTFRPTSSLFTEHPEDAEQAPGLRISGGAGNR